MTDQDLSLAREKMVRQQIEARGIRDPRLLEVMRDIPREIFVPPRVINQAYWDGALSIGRGQTISQPYIVALMTEALKAGPDDVVLEIGTGSGYQAAILARLCRWVYTMERVPELHQESARRLQELGLDNITFLAGDGSLGFPPKAPYQGIMVTAACPEAPPALLNQLDDGGRLVVPTGSRDHQVLYQITRRGDQFDHHRLCGCVFVPLIGEQGWPE
jgi:protein-L-isoaspartate(D-aspartate) O-methyltransferase